MRKWLIKINGKYLKGYNDTQTHGKTGHMGRQPRDMEMPAIVLTDSEDEAYVVEGTINLRGQIDRIMDRVSKGIPAVDAAIRMYNAAVNELRKVVEDYGKGKS